MKLFTPLKEISITEIEGLRLGNAQDLNAMTGVTVLRFDEGAKAGCDSSGTAAGRTARYAGKIPRVRRGLEITCFRRGTHGKFIHVGLTDKDRIILTEIFNDVGIVDGLEVFQDL